MSFADDDLVLGDHKEEFQIPTKCCDAGVRLTDRKLLCAGCSQVIHKLRPDEEVLHKGEVVIPLEPKQDSASLEDFGTPYIPIEGTKLFQILKHEMEWTDHPRTVAHVVRDYIKQLLDEQEKRTFLDAWELGRRAAGKLENHRLAINERQFQDYDDYREGKNFIKSNLTAGKETK